ncbi:MAG: hypothetical protein WB392_11810 [Methanotrichaceae archaeon]
MGKDNGLFTALEDIKRCLEGQLDSGAIEVLAALDGIMSFLDKNGLLKSERWI